MIEQINHLGQLWWDWMSAMFWQVGLLILLIAGIDLLIRRWAWPQLRYALWSLVLLKLVLSPALSLPSGLAPKLKPVVKQILETASSERVGEVKLPIVIPSDSENEGRGTIDEGRQTTAEARPSSFRPSSINPSIVHRPSSIVIPLDWRVYAMAAWLWGVITLGTWLFVKLRRLSKKYPDGPRQPSLPESFYDQLDRCAQRLKLRRKPRVVTTSSLQSPAVFGLFRPVLLMPVGYLRRLSRKDTEYMLLHELAHIKRGDLVAHGFYMLLQLIYWYNPLLWLVRRPLRHLRELCCDATVASLLKDKTVEYRQTLLETARRFLATPAESGLGLVGLFEDSNRLIARINWLKKPLWRYRKMKNVTVITIVLVLLACVLPMAQGQSPQAENANVTSEQAEETSSPESSLVTRDSSLETQGTSDESQAVQRLKAQLQQLQIEKQKLQEQLQALMQAQQVKGDASQAEMKAKLAKDTATQVLEKAKEAKVKADKDKAKASADALKAGVEAGKADAEAQNAEVMAKQWEQWANSEAFKQWRKDMDKWAKEQAIAHENAREAGASAMPVPNPNPHPMPVMPPMPAIPLEIEVDVEVPALTVPVAVTAPAPPQPDPAAPVAPAPPIPPAPAASAVPALPAPQPVPPTPMQATAPAASLLSNMPLLGAPAGMVQSVPTLPTPTPGAMLVQPVKVSKGKDDKYVATTEMHFTSKVKPGSPFVVRNNLGNITLRPSKDDTCDVKAVIRAEAKTADKAKEMVEQVGMNVDSSEDRYYLKPVKTDGGQWSNLSVDFTIAVPSGVRSDIKTDLGNIELYDLKGNIKALANLGSIKAVNTTGNINLATDLGGVNFTAPKDLAGGDIELVTNMGDIEFIAHKDLSAKLQAETKMGSIKSELPLKISEIDMFKRKAEGTMGTGQGNIRMQTDMGGIRLKWLPTSEPESALPKP